MDAKGIKKEVEAFQELRLWAKELTLSGITTSFDPKKPWVAPGLKIYHAELELPCTVMYGWNEWVITFPFVRKALMVKRFTTVMRRVRGWLNAKEEAVGHRSARLLAPRLPRR